MPAYCCVKGCSNWRGKDIVKARNVSFHKFPMKNRSLFKEWLDVIPFRTQVPPSIHTVICSDHFEVECFSYQRFTNRRQLKENVSPSKFERVNVETSSSKSLKQNGKSKKTSLEANKLISIMSVERRRYECTALPKGWQREEVIRKSGLSAGKIDVYYYSPSGKKFRSKPQLARYLGDAIDLSTFDFRSGKINSLLLRKNKKQKGTQFDYRYGIYTWESEELKASSHRGVRNDASLVPPIRQTASIFKQPVTVYKTQEGKVKADFKHGPQEKPKQLFWEKRLEGLKACDLDGMEFDAMELPRGLRAVGPHVAEETLLQSVATALHVSAQPVTGQTGSRSALDKNPGVFLNPDQPLVQAVAVAEDDIKRQEERVTVARKKLEDALKAIVA